MATFHCRYNTGATGNKAAHLLSLSCYGLLILLLALLPAPTTSNEFVAGYRPDYQVTDHAAIDLDQQLLQTLLPTAPSLQGSSNLTLASLIYQKGAHSKSYAFITLLETTGKINKGMAFSGTTISGKPITLMAYDNYPAGTTEVKMRYATSNNQSEYQFCQVGQNPNPVLHGCLTAFGTIQLDGIKSVALSYVYNPETDNKNGRTLAGFSTGAKSKMGTCDNCPYVDYAKYLGYYGEYDYGHQWVMAAFEQRDTNFTNGNVDFSRYSKPALHKAIQVATLNMNVWMYVVREFEDALDDCNNSCFSDECNNDKVNAWDEGIAFYTGSLEGEDGSGDGILAYELADDLCVAFKTCVGNIRDNGIGDSTTGLSEVNANVMFRLSDPAVDLLREEHCDETRIFVEQIVGYMTVPLVQGLLRATHQSINAQDDATMDVAKGEAAAFAAAVVPILHSCSDTDAAFVQQQLAYPTATGDRDYAAVKETLERHYDCMRVTCLQVGGLWDPKTNTYLPGAAPCAPPKEESSDVWKIALGAGVGAAVVIPLLVVLLLKTKKQEQPNLDASSKTFT